MLRQRPKAGHHLRHHRPSTGGLELAVPEHSFNCRAGLIPPLSSLGDILRIWYSQDLNQSISMFSIAPSLFVSYLSARINPHLRDDREEDSAVFFDLLRTYDQELQILNHIHRLQQCCYCYFNLSAPFLVLIL